MSGLLRSPNAEEAVAKPDSGAEPTMEEILASIRSLIADEGEADAEADFAPELTAAEPPILAEAEPTVVPRVVWSRPESAAAAPPAPQPFPKAIPAPEPPRSSRPAPASEPLWPASPPEPALLSAEAGEAATSSFDVLNVALKMQSSDIAERMVGEMLRPLLKTWLDENLPSIVEKLVRAEIQRVARGHG